VDIKERNKEKKTAHKAQNGEKEEEIRY